MFSIQFLGATLEGLTTLWATASTAIEATAILMALNWLSNLIRFTYQAGYACGHFFFRYLKPALICLIAFVITCVQFTYDHREEIRDAIVATFRFMNDLRKKAEKALVYTYEPPTAYELLSSF